MILSHNNDTFKKLLLYNKVLKRRDTKYVWFNNIGDVFYYMIDQHKWLENDPNVSVATIL